ALADKQAVAGDYLAVDLAVDARGFFEFEPAADLASLIEIGAGFGGRSARCRERFRGGRGGQLGRRGAAFDQRLDRRYRRGRLIFWHPFTTDRLRLPGHLFLVEKRHHPLPGGPREAPAQAV